MLDKLKYWYKSEEIIRKSFDFLIKDYGFKETRDEKLIIKAWLKNGIAYTNDKIVICFADDFRESRFVTIIYKIQSDFVIPIHDNSNYFTLKVLINQLGLYTKLDLKENYSDYSSFKEIIETTKSIIINSAVIRSAIFNEPTEASVDSVVN